MYKNNDFEYCVSCNCKKKRKIACYYIILDNQSFLFCNVTTFVGKPKFIKNYDVICTM